MTEMSRADRADIGRELVTSMRELPYEDLVMTIAEDGSTFSAIIDYSDELRDALREIMTYVPEGEGDDFDWKQSRLLRRCDELLS